MTASSFRPQRGVERNDRGLRDMIGDVSRELVENAEWQMELLDEIRKPVFRIRLMAETLRK